MRAHLQNGGWLSWLHDSTLWKATGLPQEAQSMAVLQNERSVSWKDPWKNLTGYTRFIPKCVHKLRTHTRIYSQIGRWLLCKDSNLGSRDQNPLPLPTWLQRNILLVVQVGFEPTVLYLWDTSIYHLCYWTVFQVTPVGSVLFEIYQTYTHIQNGSIGGVHVPNLTPSTLHSRNWYLLIAKNDCTWPSTSDP